jgi:predicted tellurium resistance membrane protein TerC
MRRSDPYIVLAGVAVALAVIGLTGFVVARLSATTPVVGL